MNDTACNWPGCANAARHAEWGCAEHWFRLPVALRSRIWHAVEAVPRERAEHEAATWVAAHGGRQGSLGRKA